ncbi:MAG: LemA family protein [Candidatus Sungbacteria bacterium]|uniref:LemA family protein n=1 Tax=Candidatus Sungiibacteriota bacterium TaxID=2750080 RepID=A0A932DSE1_9BACT|nr:LemA family protein [Candidatus Sungbacteria bacterium]MBI2465807.1 LemA family protein [Candidatus Sungbacteria bacterium]
MLSINWVLIGAAIVVILWIIYAFNRLVTLRARIDEAFSDIEVQLKRRYDLIPNVVETVKGYMGHERSVFENVTAARSAAMGAHDPNEKAVKENALTNTLKTLFAVSENYPELKANANFLDLQRELADTENKIQSARRFYNGNVRDFNINVDSFPSNLIAGIFSFKKREFFDLDDASPAQEPVKISF